MVLGHTVWKNDNLRVEKWFCVWKNDMVNEGKLPGRNTPINQIFILFPA